MRPEYVQSLARLRELLTFATVGLIGTAAHYAILVTSVEEWDIDPVIGSLAGAVAGAIINYFFNHWITFKSTISHRRGLPKFMFIAAAGLALNTGIMALSYGLLNFHYFVSQIIATVTVLFWNYLGSALWAFRELHTDESPSKSISNKLD